MRPRILIPALAMFFALAMFSLAQAWTHNEHIHNNTGQTVNDVHKVLEGKWRVTEMMTDTFPNTNWWQVLTPDGWRTHLTWSGPDLPHCQYAHVCFTVVDPATGDAAYGAKVLRAWFTYNGQYVADLESAASGGGMVEGNVLVLDVGNFQMLEGDPPIPAPPINVMDIAVAFVDSCLKIDDMVYDVLYDPGSPLEWIQLPPVYLEEHGMWYPMDLTFTGEPAAAVIRMTVEGETGALPYHEFAQFTMRPGGPSAAESNSWTEIKALYR